MSFINIITIISTMASRLLQSGSHFPCTGVGDSFLDCRMHSGCADVAAYVSIVTAPVAVRGQSGAYRRYHLPDFIA
jgi:hypothetical protein